MTIQGYQFDKMKVTPESDAALFSYLAQGLDNKVFKGMTATVSGLNVYIETGKALVQGRFVEVTQQHQLSAQANTSGYVVITIDLTQSNTATGTPGTGNYLPINNQLRLELVENLNQQDLSAGGVIYTLPLYTYSSTGTSINLMKVNSSYYVKSVTTTVTGMYNATYTIRRLGDTVEFVSDRVVVGGATVHEQAASGMIIPLGFRPISRVFMDIKLNNGSTIYPPMILRIDDNGTTWLTNEAIGNNRYMQAFATWKTNDPWPI